MELVEFVTTESEDDLIVSFVLPSEDELGDIRSLILMRNPKYEFALYDEERGVNVSDEDQDEDDEQTVLLEEIVFHGDQVRVVSSKAKYELDCRKVDPEELEAAKTLLAKMNFDSRFTLLVD